MGKIYHAERLTQVDAVLRQIVGMAVAACPFDVLVVCGYRSSAEQLKAYLTGKSKARPGQSKHNKLPAQAVDLIAVGNEGKEALWQRLDLLAILDEQIQREAMVQGVTIEWSKHWQKFVEFDHWEIKE